MCSHCSAHYERKARSPINSTGVHRARSLRQRGALRFQMLSHAIWRIFWSILIQNWIKNTYSRSKFRGGARLLRPLLDPPLYRSGYEKNHCILFSIHHFKKNTVHDKACLLKQFCQIDIQYTDLYMRDSWCSFDSLVKLALVQSQSSASALSGWESYGITRDQRCVFPFSTQFNVKSQFIAWPGIQKYSPQWTLQRTWYKHQS